jgi:hypothetical protein
MFDFIYQITLFVGRFCHAHKPAVAYGVLTLILLYYFLALCNQLCWCLTSEEFKATAWIAASV